MKQNNILIYGIIGACIGGVIVWIMMANAIDNNNTSMMRMMGIRQMTNQDAGQNTMMGNIDKHFIEQMIPHHDDAITMAEIALDKAQHQEIKNLAQDIKRTQAAEIKQMRKWYKEWFGTDVPKDNSVMGMHGMRNGGMHMGMMGDETDIEALKNASEFDKEFIEQMIPHHQMAVMMAQMLKNTSNREEMRKLADDIIATQTKEIDAMRLWYRNWY